MYKSFLLSFIPALIASQPLYAEVGHSKVSNLAGRLYAGADLREFMPDQDKQKWIEENRIRSESGSATREKKADAEYENNILRKERVKSLSPEDSIRRENLKADLDQLDPGNRTRALRELMTLYEKYER